MNKETKLAVGIVAGATIIVAAGFWMFSDNTSMKDEVAVPDTPFLDAPAEVTVDLNDEDDRTGDVTRIIISEPTASGEVSVDNVNVDEVLTGRVIIDDEVVLQPQQKPSGTE